MVLILGRDGVRVYLVEDDVSSDERINMFTDKLKELLADFEIDGAVVYVVRDDEEFVTVAMSAVQTEIHPFFNGLAQYLLETEFCSDCGKPLDDDRHHYRLRAGINDNSSTRH